MVGSLFSLSREARTPLAAWFCMETQAHAPWVYIYVCVSVKVGDPVDVPTPRVVQICFFKA